jgi:hypothetical protein
VGFYLQEGGIFFHDQVESLKCKGYCQEMTDGRASVQEETTPEQTATESGENEMLTIYLLKTFKGTPRNAIVQCTVSLRQRWGSI